jgi:hypothetical protein
VALSLRFLLALASLTEEIVVIDEEEEETDGDDVIRPLATSSFRFFLDDVSPLNTSVVIEAEAEFVLVTFDTVTSLIV